MAMAQRSRDTPHITPHACGSRSMRHSSLAALPRRLPSSYQARRYHPPSQGVAVQRDEQGAPAVQQSPGIRRLAQGGRTGAAPRTGTCPAIRFRRFRRPTRFMPSFQSPPPIRGRPCAPQATWSMARSAVQQKRFRDFGYLRGKQALGFLPRKADRRAGRAPPRSVWRYRR